ncbi:YkvA family protein [Halobacillus seohaensis]|uniref:YkvA family protein n=1 Tax=Halobacillus seohaensis TaxID=447421 RepID=A0ABW2EIA5_9BACI
MKSTKKQKSQFIFEKTKKKAQSLINNPDKTMEMIQRAKEKSQDNKSLLEEVWHELQLMFDLVRDWMRGNYRNTPTRSIIAIIGGILYLLVPLDAIPDFIPVAGLLDDVYILHLVIKQVQSDLNEYKVWIGEER